MKEKCLKSIQIEVENYQEVKLKVNLSCLKGKIYYEQSVILIIAKNMKEDIVTLQISQALILNVNFLQQFFRYSKRNQTN